MAGRLISTAATPLIYSRNLPLVSIWYRLSDSPRAAEEWEISAEEKRRMEYALRHLDCTVALFFRLAFLPFFFFSSDAAVPQSCGCNSVTVLPPPNPHPPPPAHSGGVGLRAAGRWAEHPAAHHPAPSSCFSLFTSISLLPRCAALLLHLPVSAGVWVSDGVLVDPASGPVVFQCHTSEAEH